MADLQAREPGRGTAQRQRIDALTDQLGPDELAVLELVAHGLARGRAVYGELVVAADPRDFKREAAEELRDAMIYIGAELARLHLKRG